jgi:hypothetical protein
VILCQNIKYNIMHLLSCYLEVAHVMLVLSGSCRSWHDLVLLAHVLKNFLLQGMETFRVILCQNRKYNNMHLLYCYLKVAHVLLVLSSSSRMVAPGA